MKKKKITERRTNPDWTTVLDSRQSSSYVSFFEEWKVLMSFYSIDDKKLYMKSTWFFCCLEVWTFILIFHKAFLKSEYKINLFLISKESSKCVSPVKTMAFEQVWCSKHVFAYVCALMCFRTWGEEKLLLELLIISKTLSINN